MRSTSVIAFCAALFFSTQAFAQAGQGNQMAQMVETVSKFPQKTLMDTRETLLECVIGTEAAIDVIRENIIRSLYDEKGPTRETVGLVALMVSAQESIKFRSMVGSVVTAALSSKYHVSEAELDESLTLFQEGAYPRYFGKFKNLPSSERIAVELKQDTVKCSEKLKSFSEAVRAGSGNPTTN